MRGRISVTTPELQAEISPDRELPGRLSNHVLAVADAHRRLLFVGIVLLYLAGFNGQWKPEPDAALYLSIGRNIAEGLGYTYHGNPHQLAYPGLPWMWAGLFSLFGDHTLAAAHALMLALGLIALGLVYRLFVLHADRPTAVIVTFGVAISRMFYRYCFELRSDLPFLVGVLAFFCGCEAIFYARSSKGRRWYDWLLLVAGLLVAIVMRPTMWALLLAIALTSLLMLLRGNWRRGAMLATVLAIGGIALFLLDPRRSSTGTGMDAYEQHVLQPSTGGTLFDKVLKVNLPGLINPAAAEALFGLDFGLPTGVPGLSLNTVPSIVALGLGVSLLRYRVLWGLFFITTSLMMLAVLPLARYFLPVLPLTVYAWWRLLVWINHRPNLRHANIAFTCLFLLAGATNLSKVAGWMWSQHQRPLLVHYRDGRFADVPKMAHEIEQRVGADEVVVCPTRMGRIISFYSRRRVVDVTEFHAWNQPSLVGYVLVSSDPSILQYQIDMPLHEQQPVVSVGRWTLYRAMRP